MAIRGQRLISGIRSLWANDCAESTVGELRGAVDSLDSFSPGDEALARDRGGARRRAASGELAAGDRREADGIGNFDLLVRREHDPRGSQAAQDPRDHFA
jgi:hypothetical protein